jgi:hypothetical protein
VRVHAARLAWLSRYCRRNAPLRRQFSDDPYLQHGPRVLRAALAAGGNMKITNRDVAEEEDIDREVAAPVGLERARLRPSAGQL